MHTSSPQQLAPREPAPSSLHLWQAMLEGLKLEAEEVAYLEGERGLPAGLCRAVGMVSTTRETWLEHLQALETRHDMETCLKSVLGGQRTVSLTQTKKLAVLCGVPLDRLIPNE